MTSESIGRLFRPRTLFAHRALYGLGPVALIPAVWLGVAWLVTRLREAPFPTPVAESHALSDFSK